MKARGTLRMDWAGKDLARSTWRKSLGIYLRPQPCVGSSISSASQRHQVLSDCDAEPASTE